MNSVLGPGYSKKDFHSIDLSLHNKSLHALETQGELLTHILNETKLAGKTLAIGGYLEERDFYLKSPLFSGERRTLHLGVDVWLPVHAPVFAAYDGIVFGKAYNDQPLDYGYTVILQHHINDSIIYALYGHLSEKNFDSIRVRQSVKSEDVVGYIGDNSENGGWAPHLHFQLIKDMQGNRSDYPGVCHKKNRDQYQSNCPNPINWIT